LRQSIKTVFFDCFCVDEPYATEYYALAFKG
jgi:hypothetical protein